MEDIIGTNDDNLDREVAISWEEKGYRTVCEMTRPVSLLPVHGEQVGVGAEKQISSRISCPTNHWVDPSICQDMRRRRIG